MKEFGQFMIRRWPEVGLIIGYGVSVYLFIAREISDYNLYVWVSVIALIIHQWEEYRVVGTFPTWINECIFGSSRTVAMGYPMNMKTACIINGPFEWTWMLLAAFVGERARWLGISVAMFQLLEVAFHCGPWPAISKKWFHPGVASAVLVFLPLSVQFLVLQADTFSHVDWGVGVSFGIVIAAGGCIGVIYLMRDKKTQYLAPLINTYRGRELGNLEWNVATEFTERILPRVN